MKRFISTILTFVILFSLCATTVGATESSSTSTGSSGVSGGSPGVSSGGSVSKPVEVIKEYTISGTIYLPSGMTAPEGGLKIYGGFGGVSFSEVNTASLSSTEDYIEEESTIDYENSEVIAIIPEGQNYVSYNTTCNIASSYNGIYGKFWVYDNVTIGNVTISNKQTISNIIQLKADVYNYANLNCILNSATTTATYTITCNNDLASENIATDVYVIADNGYDKYISKVNYDNSSVSGVLNLESSGTYTLYYYTPSSLDLSLQKLDKGLFNVGTLDFENLNTITLKSQFYLSGKINLPDGYTATKDLTVTLKTTENKVHIVIPKGTKSVPYTIGTSFNENGEYLNIRVDDEYLISGYLVDDGSFDNYKYKLWYEDTVDSIENYDINLQEQYLFKGTVSIPDDILMTENTYLKVRVGVTNLLTGYNDYTWLYILSDEKTADYTLSVPKSECVDKFVLSYDYGSYSTVTVPTYASNPLTYYRKPSSGGGSSVGGSSGGGGGSSSPNIHISKDDVTYTASQPTGLLYGCKFFVEDAKITIFEEEAKGYAFENKTINKNFTLIKSEEIYAGTIAGYFADFISDELYTMVEVSLYNTENTVVDKKIIDANEGYYFEGLNKGSYKIGFNYNDKQYYYNNKYLVENIDDAEIITLDDEIISNHNDVHFDNIFETGIKLYCEEIIINNTYYDTQSIKIYNTYGKVVTDVDNSGVIKVNLSSFYLGIGDYYVSEFILENGVCTITKLTNSIDKAYLFKAEYVDTISENFYVEAGNTFRVEAITELYNTPLTLTRYTITDNQMNFSVTLKQPVNEGEIIVATYDDFNRLIGITSTKCLTDEYEYPLFMNYSPNITKIKTMLWSGLTTLKPLGDVEEKNIPSGLDYNENLKKIANAYFVVDNRTYYVEGNEYQIDVSPTLIDSEIYLPLRAFGEALDFIVEWNSETETMICRYEGTVCSFQVESNIAERTINDGEVEQITMSGKPIMRNERMLVPCSDISKLFNFEVYTDENNGVIAIFDELYSKNKYAYDNNLLNVAKVDISSLNGYITRAEMASLLVELYENSTGNTIVPSNYQFADEEYIDGVDEDVAKAYALDIIGRYEDGKFRPNNYLTYAEAVKVIHNTVMKSNENLADKHITVLDYDSIPSDGTHWVTSFLYDVKKLGLLDGVCYDEIEIDNPINRKDAIGIIANTFYQLSIADKTEFLYICNSGEEYLGILNALQTDLYRYYKYNELNTDKFSDKFTEIAKTMYSYCSYYNTVEEFDEILKIVFDELFPSAPSSGNYS